MTTLATLVVVFALDRAAKAAAFRRFGAGGGPAFAGLVSIRPARNARPWPWRSGSPAGLVAAFALGLAAALAYLALGPIGGPAVEVGLGAALGGALGNLYDRLRHGAILDFVHFDFGGLGVRWLFNTADAALLLGLFAVLGAHVAHLAGLAGLESALR